MLTWDIFKSLGESFLFHAILATLLTAMALYIRRLIDLVLGADSTMYTVYTHFLELTFLLASAAIVLSGLWSLIRGIKRAHENAWKES